MQSDQSGEKCVTLLTQVILRTREVSDKYVRTSLMYANKNPQRSSATTGMYLLLCFLKARGERGKAYKTDEIKKMKGDGEGLNANFLWPKAALNSCYCRKSLYCFFIPFTFPVDWNLTFCKNKMLLRCVCVLTEIQMQPADWRRHKKMWSSFL